MKVLLINPPVKRGRYKSREIGIPPIGLGYLASYIEEKGVTCDVVDGKGEGLSIGEVVERILQKKPDIVGVSAMTPDIIAAGEIAKNVKEKVPDIHTVLGGAHAIAIPDETMKEFADFDFVVTGEGEETLFELVQGVSGEKDFNEIKGLGFRRGEEVVINPPRNYIRDLDELPYPAWNKFAKGSRTYYILASRGCPFSCSFCMRALGRTVRNRSPERIIDEIWWLVRNYNPKRIVFQDETFTLKKSKVLELTDLILKEGLQKKIKWVAQTRVDYGAPEIFRRMKAAGCEELEFGVESGNQEILNRVNKGITLHQVEKTVRLAKKSGLRVGCSFILGHPYETEETIQETIDFAVKLNPDLLSFGIMSPYPGTEIWKMAQAGEGNYRLLSRNWEEFLRFSGGCLELINLPRQRLEILQVKAYMNFYMRTLKFIGFLQYGLPRWKQALAVIRKLLSLGKNNAQKSLDTPCHFTDS